MKKYIKSLILILIILPSIAFMTACGTKTYTVSFDSDGGSVVNAIENIESGSKIDKPEDPTKNGYNFNGWFLNDEEWDFENDSISSDISLKASWTPVVYSITYNLNGSTNHSLNPSEFTIESETISLKAPNLTGYAFVGWYDNEDFSGDAITTIETGTVGNIELYARFVYDDIENGIRLLSSYEDLKYYLSSSNLSSNFKLINNIDFANREWAPFGTELNPYNGTFDGNGYAINNIKISNKNTVIGFFGFVGTEGKIKNLSIQNATVESSQSSYVGIIAGFSSGAIIKCQTSGNIMINQSSQVICGGIAGYASTIIECYNSGNIEVFVEPFKDTAGLTSEQLSIVCSVGGLAGISFQIQDSYSLSNLSVEKTKNNQQEAPLEIYNVGGLSGYSFYKTENCYSTGSISLNLNKSTNPEIYVAGLVGAFNVSSSLENCYASEQINIQTLKYENLKIGHLFNTDYEPTSNPATNSYALNTQTIKLNNVEQTAANCSDSEFVTVATKENISLNVVSKWNNNVWNTTSNTPSLKKEIGECFIYFETNGGSYVEKIPVAYEGTAQAPTPPTKEGYIFENWYYEDAVWYFGLSVTKTITLEARYTPRTYTVSFQDAEGNQVCENKYFTFNNPYTLPEYITYQGHYFNLNEDIFNSYYWTYNGNALNDSNWTIADNAILVLASTPKKYQVLYFLDGGANNQSNPTTYTYIDYFYELQPATKDGYTFIGWYSHQNLQEVYKVTNLSEVVDPELPKTVSLYARFAVAQYSIVYETYGAANSVNNPSSYNINTETISLHSITKDGYSFAGWYDSENFTTTANRITEIPKGSSGNIKLYAYWQVLNYAIVYNLNGGTNDADNPLFYTVEDSFFLNDAEKPYHDFVGWYQTPDFSDYAIYYIPAGTTEPLVLYAKFRLTTYTIQYVDTGAADGLQTEYNYQSSTFTFPTISKSGYNFLGWVDEQGHSITKIQKGSYGNRVITATWQIINYTITYQTNGGTLPNNTSTTFNAENIVTFATPTKRGYDFLGWKLQDEVNLIYSTNGLFRNITLVAYWDYTVYTIDYSLDDGIPVSSLLHSYTLCDSYTLPELTKDGYTFDGWFDDSNFATANKVTGFESGTIGNKYFFAKFTIINYTITYVTYDKNVNNSANPVSYTVVDNNITLQNITRTGYTFDGWYDGENFETANKVTTILTQTKANITLYAKWQIINYSITYIADVETESYTKTYTVEDSIALTIPELSGKTVSGWIDTTNGNNIITTIPKGTTGDKILKLSWEYITYNITYVINGGTFSVQEITTFNVDDSIELSIPEKTHYNFDGWFAESTFENKATEIEKGTAENKTFYAKWTAITYTISYQPNNGTLSGSEATSYTIENHVTFEIPTRTGYEFKGWFTTSNFESNTQIESTSDQSPTLGTIEIYAKWEIINYTISYITYDENVDNSANRTSFTIESETFNIEDISRIGYTFLGWYDSENFETANKIELVEKGTAKNITLFAKWQIINYSITYNTNDGTLSGSQKTTYTILDEFDFEIPTRDGYEFKGWFTTSTFENGTDLNSISAGSINDIEIYAKWEIINYTITYNTNGGTLSGSQITSYTVLDEFVFEEPYKHEYLFLGWYDSEDFETANKIEQITVGTTGNITLFAKYSETYDHEGYYKISTLETLTSYSGSENARLYSSVNLNNSEWTPINLKNSTFDGNGFVISNFKITTGRIYNGFFGEVKNSTIKNLGLENFTIDYECSDSTKAGGLVGYAEDATITACYATGNVFVNASNGAYAGGLVGRANSSTTITNCYATGDVSANANSSAYAGGLVSYDTSSKTITNCYATGDVSASSTNSSAYAGGLVGYATDSTTITDCYATGNISASGKITYFGRIVANGNPTITNCYELMEPIQIKSKEELVKLSQYTRIKGVFELTTNIDLEGMEWTPINISNGEFNGNGFVISNFKITTGRTYNGFFGEVRNSTIKNLGLENFTIDYEYSNSTDAGGLVGYANGSTITNCYATGDVFANATDYFAYAGGLVGYTEDSTISYCHATGDVSAISTDNYAYAGGLVGDVYKYSTITLCYATGAVSAISTDNSAYAGGLFGGAGYYLTITDCYATGDVSASSTNSSAYAGGLVGDNNSTITDCYATGDVSANANSYAYVGGLVGYAFGSTITNCYATGDVSANSTNSSAYAGGLVGCAEHSTITDCYRYEGQIITAIKGESAGTICTEGTSASMETIWAFVKENWDTEVWEFYDDKNPTLKISQI